MIVCVVCGKEKSFVKGKCTLCYMREYHREYYQRPEVKAKQRERMREYSRRPDVKAKKKEYQREYRRRPDVKAKQREYHRRPDVKAKKREYSRRPDVEAKHREYYILKKEENDRLTITEKRQKIEKKYSQQN